MSKLTDAPKVSFIQVVLLIFALAAFVLAIVRVMSDKYWARIDSTTLMYLAVAGALLLLKDVKSMTVGDYKIEFDRQIKELQGKVEDAQSMAIGKGGEKPPIEPTSARVGLQAFALAQAFPSPGSVPDDQWKGVFGRQSVSGNREITAEVVPLGTPGLFRVRLRVQSTNPTRDPLRGSVQFFLHQTFSNDRPVVTVSAGGVAELAVTAWGAFTVGAIADAGQTKLELDLAELKSAPMEFRER